MEKSQISSDLIRGHIDTIILYSLLDGDKFAQKIMEHVKSKSDDKYEINQATLYSSLKRLENLKYIDGYWNDSDTGRRRFFKLTDLGKSIVNENLNNWQYSRAIIDKLMDLEPEPVVKTEIVEVEKIVQVPVEVPVEVIVEKPVVEQVSSPVSPIFDENNNFITENSQNTEENPPVILSESVSEPISQSTHTLAEEQQEINFRNILTGLIKATAKPKIKPKHNSDSFSDDNSSHEDQVEVLSFNETISSTTNYNVENTNSYGKIDFSDLSLKAAQEGYKLRVSTKDARVLAGSVYINRLKLFTSLSIFLIVLLQVLLFSTVFKGEIHAAMLIIAPILGIIYPIISLRLFVKHPLKTTSSIKADTILTALIVFFNLLLITFALNLLFTVNFEDLSSLLTFFVFPIVIYLDIFLYFVLQFAFSKLKIFKTKNIKNN